MESQRNLDDDMDKLRTNMQNLTTNFGLVGQMVGELETLDDTPDHRENLRLQIEVVEEISRRVQLLLLEASVQFSGEGKRIQARYKETVRCFKSLREKADAMMARSPPNTASRPPSSAAPPHNRSNSTGGLAKDRIRQSLHHSGTMLYNSIAEAVAQGPSYPQKPSATNQATVSSHKRRAPARNNVPPTLSDAERDDLLGGNPVASVPRERGMGDLIRQYANNLALVNRMTKQIGTAEDTAENRSMTEQQLRAVSDLGDQIQRRLRDPSNLSATDRMAQEKLSRELKKLQDRFELYQKSYSSKARRIPPKRAPSAVLDISPSGGKTVESGSGLNFIGGVEPEEKGSPAPQGSTMMLANREVEEAIMREREAELADINKGLRQVNEIFQDLAVMVNEQGENITLIEENAIRAKDHAEQGLAEVQKAAKHQSSCSIS